MSDNGPASAQTDVNRAKSALRLEARAARRAVLPEMRRAAAYAIAKRVQALPVIQTASAVLLYGASPEEVDPSVLEDALRDLGLRIAYPRIEGSASLTLHWVPNRADLVSGAFGLLQPAPYAPPAPMAEISALIVPGVAFDAEGNRLGYGGGYFDTLLADWPELPPTIGIAYDEQVFEHVPHSDRDRPVDYVITPTRAFACATSRP